MNTCVHDVTAEAIMEIPVLLATQPNTNKQHIIKHTNLLEIRHKQIDKQLQGDTTTTTTTRAGELKSTLWWTQPIPEHLHHLKKRKIMYCTNCVHILFSTILSSGSTSSVWICRLFVYLFMLCLVAQHMSNSLRCFRKLWVETSQPPYKSLILTCFNHTMWENSTMNRYQSLTAWTKSHTRWSVK